MVACCPVSWDTRDCYGGHSYLEAVHIRSGQAFGFRQPGVLPTQPRVHPVSPPRSSSQPNEHTNARPLYTHRTQRNRGCSTASTDSPHNSRNGYSLAGEPRVGMLHAHPRPKQRTQSLSARSIPLFPGSFAHEADLGLLSPPPSHCGEGITLKKPHTQILLLSWLEETSLWHAARSLRDHTAYAVVARAE